MNISIAVVSHDEFRSQQLRGLPYMQCHFLPVAVMVADSDSWEHDIFYCLDLDVDCIWIAEILDDLQHHDGCENCDSSEHDE